MPTGETGETEEPTSRRAILASICGTTAGYAEADTDHWPRVLETFETLRNE
ncbi:hypothetical protein ACFQJ7_01035 [Halovenus rubra]|uniref:Uncharacterized protein n=2 Tax=Halovenus rubra TaxID=869890 RepID=A0ABD5X287_9EURY|nr:hypothetical protein [Halovenus rubra]